MGNILSSMGSSFQAGGGIQGLLENPAFQSGIGLLEANNASFGENSNPYTGALRGASRAGKAKDERLTRESFEEQQENMRKLREAIANAYGVAPGAQQAAGVPPGVAPQMSPIPPGNAPPDPFASVTGAGQPPPYATPGINPGAPHPMAQQQPPFTSAPGGNAAPGANDIAALMLQYGTPQQQQAAFTQMSAGDRFKQQLAQTESQFSRGQDLSRELQTERLDAQASGLTNAPANVREWEYYNSLSDEQRKEYLDLRRGGNRPSSRTEQRLYDYNDAAFESRSNATRYNNLAEQMVQVDPTSGVIGRWTEQFKSITGSEDAVTNLRKEWNNLRVSAAVQNLPPGVASDKDIELVMSAFLPEQANPQAIASFMRGLAKLEDIKAEYNEFAANYISQNPQRGGIGLNQAWNGHYNSLVSNRIQNNGNPVTGQSNLLPDMSAEDAAMLQRYFSQ